VLVDEYQDINALQGALCDEMARDHRSLTCVGDDAQSIYSFRGADFNQIGAFRARHPQAEIYKLTINYRSTPQILALANRSIAHNRNQYPKELTAVKQPGARPALIPLRDVFQQAEFVAQRVLELHSEYDMPLSRMAVLYRNHSHSLELQVELTRRQIPFTVRSGLRFFEQAHIKDVVAYLRARQNPQDALSWIRLLRLWPGIGAQTAEQLATVLARGEQSSAQLLAEQASLGRGRTRDALARLGKLWAILEDPALANPGDMIRRVVEQHYGEYADRNFPNAAARKEDLAQLAGYAERYPGASEFLGELALVQGITRRERPRRRGARRHARPVHHPPGQGPRMAGLLPAVARRGPLPDGHRHAPARRPRGGAPPVLRRRHARRRRAVHVLPRHRGDPRRPLAHAPRQQVFNRGRQPARRVRALGHRGGPRRPHLSAHLHAVHPRTATLPLRLDTMRRWVSCSVVRWSRSSSSRRQPPRPCPR
jgi:hypothetical protein